MIAELQDGLRQMSKQQFSAAEREAFFNVYGGKCAYTRNPLDMSSFHIDHVLPESLVDYPERLAQVKRDLGLEDTFDLNGYENLLPSGAGPNMQKSDAVFDTAHVHFFLGLAKSKQAAIEAELAKIARRRSSGKVLILLQQALESGKLKPAEVAEILEKYGEEPEKIFHLLHGVDFGAPKLIEQIAAGELDALRDVPVAVAEGLELTHDSDGKRAVRTCREYEQAIKDGFYPMTTVDIKMATFFEHRAGLLNVLERSREPIRSFINQPRVGIVDLRLMPFTLFPSPEFGSEPSLEATYQDKVDSEVLVIKSIAQNRLLVEEAGGGFGQQMIEVSRADFNGDGIEDILLFEYDYATHGSFGAGTVRVLTRKSADGPFEEVQI